MSRYIIISPVDGDTWKTASKTKAELFGASNDWFVIDTLSQKSFVDGRWQAIPVIPKTTTP